MAEREVLLGMFPNADVEVIDAVLESSGRDIELAAETLLEMASDNLAPGAMSRLERATTEQQIEEDEALARQIQLQLIREQDLIEDSQQQRALVYPGTAEYVVPSSQSGMTTNSAQTSQDEASFNDGLTSLGNAVYSASAATASAAGSLISGLWSWATNPSDESTRDQHRGGGRGSPPPIELREVSRGVNRDLNERNAAQVRARDALPLFFVPAIYRWTSHETS